MKFLSHMDSEIVSEVAGMNEEHFIFRKYRTRIGTSLRFCDTPRKRAKYKKRRRYSRKTRAKSRFRRIKMRRSVKRSLKYKKRTKYRKYSRIRGRKRYQKRNRYSRSYRRKCRNWENDTRDWTQLSRRERRRIAKKAFAAQRALRRRGYDMTTTNLFTKYREGEISAHGSGSDWNITIRRRRFKRTRARRARARARARARRHPRARGRRRAPRKYRRKVRSTRKSRCGGNKCDEWFIYGYGQGCFIAGTQVSMADGSYKNIEEVKVGEMVKSFNKETEEIENAEVLVTTKPIAKRVYTINDDLLTTTERHPLFVTKPTGEKGWASFDPEESLKVYKDIDSMFKLELGDKIKTIDGKEIRISSLRVENTETEVFNLYSVKNLHTFYVNDILVHNGGSGGGGGPGGGAGAGASGSGGSSS